MTEEMKRQLATLSAQLDEIDGFLMECYAKPRWFLDNWENHLIRAGRLVVQAQTTLSKLADSE